MRSTDAMQPLAFSILYGLTPENIETHFMDKRLQPLDFPIQKDRVAIPVETYTAKRSYEISTAYRQRGVPVIRGFDFKTNLRSLFRQGIYLTCRSLFRKEAFKKQGMYVGQPQARAHEH
jgi:hypothetical protein